MGWLSNMFSTATSVLVKAAEGAYRPGPYYLPVTNAFLPADVGAITNWWQCGYTAQPLDARSAIIEACVGAYSQTVAMCPGTHWLANAKGGRDRVTNSALCRMLREPNDYQSISDFLLNMVRSLYLEGNAYALLLRNSRFEISEMHVMHPRMSWPVIAVDGSIFYTLGGNYVIMNRLGELLPLVPARDVLHIKLHTPRHPLRGVSPILAAMLDIATNDALKGQQLQFYLNQAKPGFVLSTDLLLDKDQVSAARDRWEEHSKGIQLGGTVILNGGLKPVAIPTITGRDSQAAEIMKMTKEDIALAFRIPMQILGIGGIPHGSTEALMQHWIATGLGFCLNHVEEAMGLIFGLKGQPDDYLEFDTEALERSAFKDRIDALTKAVQGGIFSPNEARNRENLDSVSHGEEPRVQQQVVPLSAAAGISAGPGQPKTIIPASPAPPAPPPGAPPGSKSDAKSVNRQQLLARERKFRQRRYEEQRTSV
jgi:HK97 family phage portal protein